MKKILMVCLLALLSVGIGSAQNSQPKGKNLVTTVFATDIDCGHCSKKIMENIPFEKGVKDVKVDLAAKKVTVVYDSTKTNDAQLIKAFDKIKVKAEAPKR